MTKFNRKSTKDVDLRAFSKDEAKEFKGKLDKIMENKLISPAESNDQINKLLKEYGLDGCTKEN